MTVGGCAVRLSPFSDWISRRSLSNFLLLRTNEKLLGQVDPATVVLSARVVIDGLVPMTIGACLRRGFFLFG